MTEDTKPDTVTLMCPECQTMVEVHDSTLVLLATHLAQFCPETEGLLHGSA